MNVGGIVLCGGKSSRMGLPKAMLPFGAELMLERVVRLLSVEVSPIVVVAARGQTLPALSSDILVAHDQLEGRGPLEGLHAGLVALSDHAEAAYATSCDVPLLVPAFVRHMIDLLGEHQIAVPQEEQFYHPLAAVYRTSLIPDVQRLLDQDKLRPAFLFESVSTHCVGVDRLKDADRDLSTLANLNHPQQYLDALAKAGYSAADEVLRQLKSE